MARGEGRERSWCSSDFLPTIHLTGVSHYKICAEPTSLPAGNDIAPPKRLAFHAVGRCSKKRRGDEGTGRSLRSA